MPNKKSDLFPKNRVLAYMLLVGLPVLGLFSILEAGRGLAPPPAISGDWDVQVDASDQAADNCLTNVQRPFLNITQSGSNVTMGFNRTPKTVINASLGGNRLTGTATTPFAGSCGDGAVLRVDATVTGKPGKHAIDGRLFFDGCTSCAPVSFHARPSALRKPGPNA
ncbi:MAG TPA: hypothetical protein VLX58_11775 [Bryobacteraceae bacterium]|nr:hypothetical protein [Bryobacteraceae bacterium]